MGEAQTAYYHHAFLSNENFTSFAKYDFTFTYGSGDYYTGYVYAETATTAPTLPARLHPAGDG